MLKQINEMKLKLKLMLSLKSMYSPWNCNALYQRAVLRHIVFMNVMLIIKVLLHFDSSIPKRYIYLIKFHYSFLKNILSGSSYE